MSPTVEQDVDLYRRAKQFLISKLQNSKLPEGQSPQGLLEEHLYSEISRNEHQTLPQVFRRLIFSAGNRQSMPRVIFGSLPSKDQEDLAGVLFDFDQRQVTSRYENWESLWLRIRDEVKPRGQLREGPRSLWPQYCRSIISAAQFLSAFDSSEDFYSWIARFYDDPRAQIGLPLTLASQIEGLGFALACDFLKEFGFLDYAKPDVHLKDLLFATGAASSRDDVSVFKAIHRIAQRSQTSPYTIDKTFWLIGTRNFYRVGWIAPGNWKREFLNTFQSSHLSRAETLNKSAAPVAAQE